MGTNPPDFDARELLIRLADDEETPRTARVLAALRLHRGDRGPKGGAGRLASLAVEKADDDGGNDDTIECCGSHRGAPLHAGQPAERLAIVRADIDCVLSMHDPGELLRHAEDPAHAPEARLAAALMVEAAVTSAIQDRTPRPIIDLGRARATIAKRPVNGGIHGPTAACLTPTASARRGARCRCKKDDVLSFDDGALVSLCLAVGRGKPAPAPAVPESYTAWRARATALLGRQ